MKWLRGFFCICLITAAAQTVTAQDVPKGSPDGKLTRAVNDKGTYSCEKINTDHDWDTILKVIRDYREKVQDDSDNGYVYTTSVNAVIFSKQLLYIAEISNNNRRAPGWAGEFIRGLFSIIAQDLLNEPEYWINNRGKYEELTEHLDGCRYWVPEPSRVFCGTKTYGTAHFVYHLKPGFHCLIHKSLAEAVRRVPAGRRVKAAWTSYRAIEDQHEGFLKNAVGPAFSRIAAEFKSDSIRQAWLIAAGELIPINATTLRRKAASDVINDLAQEGLISSGERHQLQLMLITPTAP